jgi:hypothetical protein
MVGGQRRDEVVDQRITGTRTGTKQPHGLSLARSRCGPPRADPPRRTSTAR